jgi:hypothetical protein
VVDETADLKKSFLGCADAHNYGASAQPMVPPLAESG